MGLAFLDNAFKEYASPVDLFLERNRSHGERPICLKESVMNVPILRRTLGNGQRKISPTLAWTAGSVNTESQRIVRDAGFPQRFTFYNIRRGVSNKLGDSKSS
jgi:hypothetical protein